MGHYVLKVILTALVIVAVSELGKRSNLWGAVLASLPLTSLLAFAWMRIDGVPVQQIANLSYGIFWLVLPSLLLFLLFPWFLRLGMGFTVSLTASCAVTAAGYGLMVLVLRRFGLET